jgi:7,8-dihydropterin-6-yl-methyl-4-(beta-D-ribofuranosyl)aminobenzene 5'-phosphate synthase
MKLRPTFLIAAGLSILISIAAPASAAAPESRSQITILYDAFGNDPSMSMDWGFSALVEIAESGSCSTPGITPTYSQPM